ncbi:cold-shock protein [Bradyrhizobium ottawaense]|uniref:cold-shock protein n=1 Tax=Bradyrhizobium ottawaense TaxID=931866 RepID=UPI003FA11B39
MQWQWVNWFNATKGYGFIQPGDGGADVFVHFSAVDKVGYTSFAEGARVSYDMKAGRSGKIRAEKLRIG